MLQQTRGLRVYRGPQANYRASYGDITSEVITAEEELLTNQRLADQVHEQRLLTTIQLVQALGGGWRGSTVYTRGACAAPEFGLAGTLTRISRRTPR